MPLVSIIVPVYNVEKYLERCVASLCCQTLSDIEIILVNDGSTDDSGKICESLSSIDKRITVVHKLNGGLSSARNAGLKIAQGDYVGFVDSDDDVEICMYEKMYNLASQLRIDCVMSDYLRISGDGSRKLKTLDIEEGFYDKEKMKSVIFPQLIMRENIEYGPLLSVWHCLYRNDFLKKNQLAFDEKIRWSEDNIFSAIMGYHCKRFYYMKGEALYHYYENPGTITTSYRKNSWDVYCMMNSHLHNFFDSVPEYDFSDQLKSHLIYYACNCIGQELNRPYKEAKQGIKVILSSRKLKEVFKSYRIPKVSVKLKIQLYLVKYRQASLLYFLKK